MWITAVSLVDGGLLPETRPLYVPQGLEEREWGKKFHDRKEQNFQACHLPPHLVLKNKLKELILQVSLYCGHKGTGKEWQKSKFGLVVFVVRPLLLLAWKLLQ